MIVYYLSPLALVHAVCILYSQFFGGLGVKIPSVKKKVVDSLSAPDNFSQHQYRTDDFSFFISTRDLVLFVCLVLNDASTLVGH